MVKTKQEVKQTETEKHKTQNTNPNKVRHLDDKVMEAKLRWSGHMKKQDVESICGRMLEMEVADWDKGDGQGGWLVGWCDRERCRRQRLMETDDLLCVSIQSIQNTWFEKSKNSTAAAVVIPQSKGIFSLPHQIGYKLNVVLPVFQS